MTTEAPNLQLCL